MAEATWNDWSAGRGCPFDAPRPDSSLHWDLIAKLGVSSWYLEANQQYRGHGVLVFDPRHVTRIDELAPDEWQAYAAGLQRVTAAVVAVCRPDHLNIESLGNVVPHLHWHVIARDRDDVRWGAPIWTPTLEGPPEHDLPRDERAKLLAALRAAL